MTESRCIIHVGLGKTGSSYIQSALDKLSQEGALQHTCYPSLHAQKDFMSIQSGNGVDLAHLLNPNLTPDWKLKDLRNALRHLTKQHRDKAQTLLISSEMFSDCDTKRFAKLRHVLENDGYTVTVLACIREIRSWFFSTYQQGVKRSALTETFEEFARDKFAEYTHAILSRLADLGDGLQSFPYDSKTLFADFLGQIGEDPALTTSLPQRTVNRSLTREELQLLLAVNTAFESKDLAETISDAFLYQLPDLQPTFLDPEERELIESLIPKAQKRAGTLKGAPIAAAAQLLFATPAQPTGQTDAADSGKALPILLDILKERCEEWTLIRGYLKGLKRSKGPFDPVHYALMYPNVLRKQRDLKAHFLSSGKTEGRTGRLRSP